MSLSPPRRLQRNTRTFGILSVVGMLGALIPPVVVWLGRDLINDIVHGLHGKLHFHDLLPTVLALGVLAGLSRAIQGIQGRRSPRCSSVDHSIGSSSTPTTNCNTHNKPVTVNPSSDLISNVDKPASTGVLQTYHSPSLWKRLCSAFRE